MNMSYCRVRNTVEALHAVIDNLDNIESEEERKALIRLCELAKELLEAVGDS